MRQVRHSLWLLTLTGLISYSNPAQAADPADPPWLKQVGPYLARTASAGFQGSIIIADRQGRPLFEKAYGLSDTGAGLAFTPETAVNIGSVRKAYIAAAIMALAEDGSLVVEQTIGRYLPRVPADKHGITIHHLLTHTAGLPDDFGTPLDRLERDELAHRILRLKLLFDPGTDYRYSDAGYALLQVIAERVSDTPFRGLVEKRILNALDITHTGFPDDARWAFNGGTVPVARGYINGSEDRMSILHRPRRGWSPLGAGPMLSTPRDAVTWMRALLEGQLLSGEGTAKLFAPHVELNEGKVWYGYGWHLIRTEARGSAIGHGGATRSHNFYVQYLKDDGLYIAAASNRIDVMRRDLNADGDMNDSGETVEIFYAVQVAGGLARAIHQRDFSVLPRFMQRPAGRDG